MSCIECLGLSQCISEIDIYFSGWNWKSLNWSVSGLNCVVVQCRMCFNKSWPRRGFIFYESMHVSFLLCLFAFWSSRHCIYTSNRSATRDGDFEEWPPPAVWSAERPQWVGSNNGPNWVPYKLPNGIDNSGYKFSIKDLNPETTEADIQAFWVAILLEELEQVAAISVWFR